MSRPSRTGVRGLYWDPDKKCFRIDLRWKDVRTGAPDRYREQLPKGTKKPAAERRTRDVMNLALSGELRKQRKGPASLRAAFDEYLDHVRAELGERARKDRKRHGDLLVAALGGRPMVELSPLDVERYKAARRKATRAPRGKPKERESAPVDQTPLGPATINRELATLKHFIGKAAEWGWIEEGQASRLRKVKLLKEPPGRVRWLSDSEREKLFAVLPKGFRRLVVADALSGLRRGELVTLRKDQVDLQKRVLTLTKTKSNRVRVVPINPELAVILEDAMKASKGLHVFESRHRVAYTPDGVSSFFRKLCIEAGVEDFHWHDLRHDFATQSGGQGRGSTWSRSCSGIRLSQWRNATRTLETSSYTEPSDLFPNYCPPEDKNHRKL
jgi:integrase